MKPKQRCVLGAFLGLAYLAVLAAPSPAQVVNGKRFEFSTSASMWNVKFKNDETETVINLPFRLGFYAQRGFGFEPELFLTIPEESEDTGILVFGNFTYNLQAAPKVLVFVLGGVGFGNCAQAMSLAIDQEDKVFALNFGAGLKILIGGPAALRIEYRFVNYYGEDRYFRTDHNILTGISIFF